MVKDIIRNLKLIREDKNFSQEQVADLMKKTQSAYARIERGATKIDLETLCKFAEVMELPLIEVISWPKKVVIENENFMEVDSVLIKVKRDMKKEIMEIMLRDLNTTLV
ncbi:MAG: helix-turn-helix transcriptional regulator [Marinilabiliaceae bacterium]|nr:helix-turn-helix transcriptional regulator [Marinilabiliaceae bacterium]